MTRLPSILLAMALLTAGPAAPAEKASATARCTTESLTAFEQPSFDYLRCARDLLGPGEATAPVSTDLLYKAIRMLAERADTRPSADDVEALRLFVQRLEARHAVRPWERRSVVDILLKNGRLAEAEVAKQLVASRRSQVLPGLEPLPASARQPGEARYWTWDTAANRLSERSVDLARGAHVVVSTSTGCGFCNALATALPNDPALARAFAEHALWISRPDDTFGAKYMAAWEARHPATAIVTVFDLTGWPHPEPWSTPFFYFMRDGQVVSVVQAYWPERIGELRAGFSAIGVRVDRP